MSIILFYDLETTGLPKKGDDPLIQPGIIQIGAAMVDTAQWVVGGLTKPEDRGIMSTFNMKVDPELARERWEPGASRANGVYFGDRNGEASFFTIGAAFAHYATGAEFLSGYNILGFDNKVLMWQLRRYGMEFNFPWPAWHVDIMDMAKKSGAYAGKRGAKAPKLVNLYQEITGEPLAGAHDAMNDIVGTIVCARAMAGETFDY